jgi:hypothetical protein
MALRLHPLRPLARSQRTLADKLRQLADLLEPLPPSPERLDLLTNRVAHLAALELTELLRQGPPDLELPEEPPRLSWRPQHAANR